MSENWKPGDVAKVLPRGGDSIVGMRVSWGWEFGTIDLSDEDIEDARRLVVLDLDDSEKANLLERANGSFDFRSVTVNAIREQCSPAKSEEPTGLGAVVEDAEGELWVQFGSKNGRWWRNHQGDNSRWGTLAVVRVLSEGVAP